MKKYALILFFSTLLIFNLNLNITGSGDNTPARLLPFNLFSGKGFFLDDYLPFLPKDPSFLQKFHDHYISSYPILPGILATPFYLPFYLILQINHLSSLNDYYLISLIAEKLTASIYASLSVVTFFFLFNAIFKDKKISFIFSLIFALASQTFSISSQHLWQHTMANLFLILSFYFFSIKKYFFSILLSILCLFSRNIYLLYIPLLLTMVILEDKRRWKIYIMTALAGVIAFAAINFYLYGLLIGTEAVSAKYFDPSRFLSNLAILLFSPARGIIFYTPFFIFGFASIFIKKKILILNLLWLYAVLFIYAFYQLVDDGWVWGDRYLTDGAVPAVILSYYFLSHYKSKLLTALFVITIIYSVFTQIIGTFFYTKARWDGYPERIQISLQRLWDFQDNPISRNLATGVKLDGYYILYYTLADIESKAYADPDKACQIESLNEDYYLGYKRISIRITNNSVTDWLTSGNEAVQIRQFFTRNGQMVAKSPIPPTFLPPVIKAHSNVNTQLIIVPPKVDFDSIVIAPAQVSLIITPYQEKVSLWDQYCRVILHNI